VERIPLKPADPTALELEYQKLHGESTARVVPRYTPPAANAGKKKTDASGVAVVEEGEGEGPGWGADEEDDDEAANRQRLAEEEAERDPVRRAAIDKDPHNLRRYRTLPCTALRSPSSQHRIPLIWRLWWCSKRSEHLYLIVRKPRPSAEHDWGFPQGGFEADKDSKSLRATAERELAEECGAALHVHPMGNAPIGFFQYKFKPPVAAKLKFDGQKVCVDFGSCQRCA
jgi:hypothetical protein